MREDLDNHRRLFDGGDDLEFATTHAALKINVEHTPQQPRPTHTRWRAVRVFVRRHAGILRWTRHDRRTQPGIGRQHPMKTDQMQARARHQRGQALHEFQRRHPDVRGAVAPRAFELQYDIPRSIALEPLVGDRGAGDVAAQAFEFIALMGATAHPGVQTEPVRIDAQAPPWFSRPGRPPFAG